MPKLFQFQAKGLTQIFRHQQEHPEDRSVLIGDEMGLGKTVEAIVYDNEIRKRHDCSYTAQTLIVTQTSVMDAWRRHYQGDDNTPAWAPWLNVYVINRKDRDGFLRALKAKTPNGYPKYHVFICHWQALRFMADEIKAHEFFHVIGDEIHNIKNRGAQQSMVFKKIRTFYKTGLSGTWADNKPEDAWSVLNWLWPKRWSSYWAFFNNHVLRRVHTEGFCDECMKTHKRKYTETVGIHDFESIHERMAGAYLRRLKEVVWKDLPDKLYETRWVDLEPKQKRMYDAMAKEMLAWVGENEDQPVASPAVISQLIRLQQFALASAKVVTQQKKRRLKPDELEALEASLGRELTKQEKYQEYERDVVELSEPSSKLDAAMDLIGENREQIVVFSQSKQVIHLLKARLDRAGITSFALTGDAPQAARDMAVQEFQAGRIQVFLSTIKAGGVGITLTAASTCLFLDLAWSPSANKQAEDRLHRLGQKNAVRIIVLAARDTIDPDRNDKISLKWEWIKGILNPKQKVGV